MPPLGGHWSAFGSAFFARHQRVLLWLLNAPVLRWWFRWVLRINGKRSGVGTRRVTGILPHAIGWNRDDGQQVAEFRTHRKYSKRLYYAFRPFWWALHAWDWAVADRWVPRLSFGFAVLTAFPDPDPETTSMDGYVGRIGTNEAWSTIRAGAGNSSDAGPGGAVFVILCSGTTSQFNDLRRAIFLFDTSALTSAATISIGTISLNGVFQKLDPQGWAPDVDIYASTPASNTAIANADFGQIGSVSQTGAPISNASWTIGSYNVFTLDATGRGNISKTSISKFATRNANYDVANVSPTPWSSGAQADAYCDHADAAGTSSDPTLTVTYTLPGGSIPVFMNLYRQMRG